jgi:hypothetical protein
MGDGCKDEIRFSGHFLYGGFPTGRFDAAPQRRKYLADGITCILPGSENGDLYLGMAD